MKHTVGTGQKSSEDLSLEEHGGLTMTLYTYIYIVFAKLSSSVNAREHYIKNIFYIYTVFDVDSFSSELCDLHPGCTLASGTKNRLV